MVLKGNQKKILTIYFFIGLFPKKILYYFLL